MDTLWERVMSELVIEWVSEEVQLYYSFLRKDLWPALIYQLTY
jgi:hypothetical protein